LALKTQYFKVSFEHFVQGLLCCALVFAFYPICYIFPFKPLRFAHHYTYIITIPHFCKIININNF
ncbi:MAG: hypothetical protein MR981_02390, partial [Ruminococcus bromii]|nr:hypothetical protein [Ruminococcus bromii]